MPHKTSKESKTDLAGSYGFVKGLKSPYYLERLILISVSSYVRWANSDASSSSSRAKTLWAAPYIVFISLRVNGGVRRVYVGRKMHRARTAEAAVPDKIYYTFNLAGWKRVGDSVAEIMGDNNKDLAGFIFHDVDG